MPLPDMGEYESGYRTAITKTRRALNTLEVTFRPARVPIASRATPSIQTGTGLSGGSLRGGTARVRHVAVRTSHGFRLLYSNHYPETGALETSGPNPITVKASIEMANGSPLPVSFNGADSVVIAPGANVLSDVIGLDVVKGAGFYTRTHVTTASAGQKFPRGGVAVSASDGGHNYADPAGADLTTGAWPGTQTINEYVFGPSAILGIATDPDKSVVAIIGDSISAGTGDQAGGGWIERLLNGNYSYVKVAYPSESAATFRAPGGIRRYRRLAVVEESNVTHVVAAHIRNDVADAAGQYLNMAQGMLDYWRTLTRLGLVYAPTCTPQTTSTDNWSTPGNQSPFYPATERESNRVAYNRWLRDGAPMSALYIPSATGGSGLRIGDTGHPLDGFIDVADLTETSRDSGKWKSGYTSDGTHPNAVGAAAIAAAIDPTTLFGAVSIV